jgi:hypothetical protein
MKLGDGAKPVGQCRTERASKDTGGGVGPRLGAQPPPLIGARRYRNRKAQHHFTLEQPDALDNSPAWLPGCVMLRRCYIPPFRPALGAWRSEIRDTWILVPSGPGQALANSQRSASDATAGSFSLNGSHRSVATQSTRYPEAALA